MYNFFKWNKIMKKKCNQCVLKYGLKLNKRIKMWPLLKQFSSSEMTWFRQWRWGWWWWWWADVRAGVWGQCRDGRQWGRGGGGQRKLHDWWWSRGRRGRRARPTQSHHRGHQVRPWWKKLCFSFITESSPIPHHKLMKFKHYHTQVIKVIKEEQIHKLHAEMNTKQHIQGQKLINKLHIGSSQLLKLYFVVLWTLTTQTTAGILVPSL